MSNIDKFSFHDSQLTMIELGERKAILSFKLVDGACIGVKLLGLSRMLCNNLKEGNTVLEVSIVRESKYRESLLYKLFDLSDNEKISNPDYVRKIKKKLEDQELIILLVAPSYGCELIALCEEVQVYIK
ncbi:MAG: hypothetical protein ABW094_19580 [Candidatus Thiodiazotropha sp.]